MKALWFSSCSKYFYVVLYGLSPLLQGIISLNVAYVLGAGASKDAGLPLYGELLDIAYPKQIRKFLDNRGLSTEDKKFFEGMIEKVESKILTLSSHGTDVEQLLDRFSSEDNGLYEQLVDHYYTLIRVADSIYHSFRLPYTIERLPPFLHALQAGGSKLSIISFNHDLLIEYSMEMALKFFGLRFSYGLNRERFTTLEQLIQKKYVNEPPPCYYDIEALSEVKTIPLLKLHGSFSWAICARCEHLVVGADDIGQHLAPYNLAGQLFCPKCNGDLLLSIIAPKKAKTVLDMAGSWAVAHEIYVKQTRLFLPDTLSLFTTAMHTIYLPVRLDPTRASNSLIQTSPRCIGISA